MFNFMNSMIMKKIYSYVFTAVASVAAVSCQKEMANEKENIGGEAFEVIAIANDVTKTTLVDGVKTYWVGNDELTVFDAEVKNQKFTTDITESAASARFTTSSFAYPAESETAKLVAVYPYTAGATFNGTEIAGLKMPNEQTASEGNIDPKATIAYANGTFSDNRNLKFKNAYGLFKFAVGETGVTSVVITSNNENLVGNVSVSLSDGKMSIKSNGTQTVTLKGTFTKGKVYYVAAVPGTFSQGIKVSLGLSSGNVEVKSTSNSVTLNANAILELGTLQKKAEDVTIPGGHNGWNTAVSGTPTYYLTWWHVARNVKIGTNEFKFVVDGKWSGGTKGSSTYTSYQAGTDKNDNISINGATANQCYDIYFNKSNYKYYIVPTDNSPWAVAGNFTNANWNDTHMLKPERDYFVVRNVDAPANFEFKFRFKGTWDFAYPNNNVTTKLAAGKYDFYMKKDMSAYAYAAAGTALAQLKWNTIQ